MKKLKLITDYKEFVSKSAGKLRAFCAAAWPFLILTALSCEKPDVPPVCPDGDCQAEFIIPFLQDENGYFDVKLDFTGKYSPRFSVGVEADPTHSYYWYNETPVVEARFNSSSYIQLQHEKVPVVQPTRIYLSGDSTKKLYGKRIIGPILEDMIGDTLKVDVEIFWDAGGNYKIKNFSLKFKIM